MDNKNKTVFLALAVMFIICTGFTSLSFSYFINSSTTEADVLTSALINNYIEYDGENVLAPNETRNVTLNITSNNIFDSYFKVFYKGDIKVECDERTMNLIKSNEKKLINVVISNPSNEYKSFSFGISSALSGEQITLKYDEFGI